MIGIALVLIQADKMNLRAERLEELVQLYRSTEARPDLSSQ
jgi:hypothetical protein